MYTETALDVGPPAQTICCVIFTNGQVVTLHNFVQAGNATAGLEDVH